MAGKPLYGAPRDLHKRCKARSKQNNRRCKNPAMIGKEVCRMHGGKTPVGPAHGAYKMGKYSKALPPRLLATFAESLNDPELLSLRREISLVDARLTDLLSRVDTGEAGRLWREARDAMKQFRLARAAGDTVNMNRYLGEIEQILGRGVSDYSAWDEVMKAMAERRRLGEAENKRLVQAGQMLTLAQVLVLIDNMMLIIQDVVRDGDTLKRLSEKMGRLLATEEALQIVDGMKPGTIEMQSVDIHEESAILDVTVENK